MKIGVLTSSRADYSIYYPLLKSLSKQNDIELDIIAFGTHLKKEFGSTIDAIKSDGFNVAFELDNMSSEDSPKAISNVMGKTMQMFASLWEGSQFDLVFALGDRYEMFAAVASSVPFNIPIAHIHGGETTLGAIDDCFRHSITLMSKLHFVTTEKYKERVVEIIGKDSDVFNVGALSFDNMKNLQLLSTKEFFNQFKIDLEKPSLLITFHPETVGFTKNELYVNELIASFKELSKYQLIITMPNADTTGKMVRNRINTFISENNNAVGIESFGTIGYLTCMKYCTLMLGNTSSGFVEAAYFPTKVVNVGNRQKGRILTGNMINSEIKKDEILRAVEQIQNLPPLDSLEIYGDGNTSQKIVEIIMSSING